MTNIEQEFFKTFGIEPKIKDGCKYADNYWNNEKLANKYGTFDAYLKEKCPYENKECYTICSYSYDKEVYPEITDRILLELICLYEQRHHSISILNAENIEILKNLILKTYIQNKGYFTHNEIQQLFKEEE